MTALNHDEIQALRRRAERGCATLRDTDHALGIAIIASSNPADALVERLARHREAGARLLADADDLCSTLDRASDAARRVRGLELAVQRFVGDVTADELSRKMSHGEE